MKVALIYSRILSLDGKDVTIGGIQSYLLDLNKLCSKNGWEFRIFQLANEEFNLNASSATIIGVPCKKRSSENNINLFIAASKWASNKNDIIIFGDFGLSIPSKKKKTIAIQHGIYWDSSIAGPNNKLLQRSTTISSLWRKLKLFSNTRKIINKFNSTGYRVCVDYNFLNWYRTQVTDIPEGKIWVIPNYAQIPSEDQIRAFRKLNGDISILFPRRFQDYRGARLIVQAAKAILAEYNNVTFTFAGEGPKESYFRREFEGENRVSITKFNSSERLGVYLSHSIVVVPSLRSEGTSFAVAEGLASGCVVIASNVGGITNMIIDGFNGSLIMPTVEALVATLRKVLNNQSLQTRISRNAYETAKSAFSSNFWEGKWQKVLEYVENDDGNDLDDIQWTL